MKRPLIWITVGYIIGIIWGLYLKISIVPIFLLFGGLIFLNKRKYIKIENKFLSKFKNTNCILLFLIFVFISNTQVRYLESKHENLYQDVDTAQVVGTIISDKKETTYKTSYTIKVDSINNSRKYKGTNILIYLPKNIMLDYGDKISLNGNYERANVATNYKGFDYREYLKQKNIYGIVHADEVRVLEKNNLNCVKIIFNNIRTKIKLNLKEVLGEESKVTIGILLRRYL